MRLIAKACATILLAASASGAAAGVIYEAQGNLYDIETVSGLLSNLRSTIEAQAWFADESLARDLANEVGRSLGLPNTAGMYGPMFATSIYDGAVADYTIGWIYYPNRPGLPEENRAQSHSFGYSNTWTFAVGSLVGPVPSMVPEPPQLAFVALAAMLLVGRNKRSPDAA
ncbi:MAG: hypothetical protein KDF24_06665 [Rhodocyclaceae bacterium]|nr:hypothetical protein [Rhodocyclaceae bacterium]